MNRKKIKMKTKKHKNLRKINFIFCILGLGMLQISEASTFSLKSEVIKEGSTILAEQVFNSFGCSGLNKSPDLEWSNAPKDTKAFALTVFDKDAPTGSGWWHWVVINIPNHQQSLPLGASGNKGLIGGLETRTDFGMPGYGGPCPPLKSGKHRYIFTVYALKELIPVDQEASAAMVGFYIHNLKIAEAKISAQYSR